MAPRRGAHSSDSGEESEEERRVRATSSFMREYLAGPTRKVAPPQAAAARPVASPPARAAAAAGGSGVGAAVGRALAAGVPLGAAPPARAAAGADRWRAVVPGPSLHTDGRRPTRPVSPPAAWGGPSLRDSFSSLALLGGAHSPSGSFTPSEGSDADQPGALGAAAGGWPQRPRAAVPPPPSVLDGGDKGECQRPRRVDHSQDDFEDDEASDSHCGGDYDQADSRQPSEDEDAESSSQNDGGTASASQHVTLSEVNRQPGSDGWDVFRGVRSAGTAAPAPAVWHPPSVAPAPPIADAPLQTALLLVDPAPGGEWRRLVAAARDAGHLTVAVVTPAGGGLEAASALASSMGADGPFAHILCGRRHDGGSLLALAADVVNAGALARFHPVAALPGGIDGAHSCDLLAELLGLPHSPVRRLLARCDKAACREALVRAGVPVTPGATARWPEDAWAVGRAHGFPVVVRDPGRPSTPAWPAAWRCDTEAAAGAAVGRGMELNKDPQQRTRRLLLVEPLLQGDAFLMGVHASPHASGGVGVTHLWHMQAHPAAGASCAEGQRRAGGSLGTPYDQAVLVDATAPEYAALVAHGLRVCGALEFRTGGAHLRLRAHWTPGRGASQPLLLSFWPTFAPGGFDVLAAMATSLTAGVAPSEHWEPFSAALLAATKPELQPLVVRPPPPPRPRMHARVVYIATPHTPGRVSGWQGEAQIMRLTSYASHTLVARPGARVAPQPQPCRNAVAAVRLLHQDWATVEADAAFVFATLRCVVAPDGKGARKAQCAQQ